MGKELFIFCIEYITNITITRDMKSFVGTGYSKIVEQLEENKKNIFLGAKFGDRFRTKAGNIAIFIFKGRSTINTSRNMEYYLAVENTNSKALYVYDTKGYCQFHNEDSIVAKVSPAVSK